MTMNGAMMTLGQSQKKTGKIRGLGGVEGFLFDAPVVWQRETYKEKGHYVTGQERKERI